MATNNLEVGTFVKEGVLSNNPNLEGQVKHIPLSTLDNSFESLGPIWENMQVEVNGQMYEANLDLSGIPIHDVTSAQDNFTIVLDEKSQSFFLENIEKVSEKDLDNESRINEDHLDIIAEMIAESEQIELEEQAKAHDTSDIDDVNGLPEHLLPPEPENGDPGFDESNMPPELEQGDPGFDESNMPPTEENQANDSIESFDPPTESEKKNDSDEKQEGFDAEKLKNSKLSNTSTLGKDRLKAEPSIDEPGVQDANELQSQEETQDNPQENDYQPDVDNAKKRIDMEKEDKQNKAADVGLFTDLATAGSLLVGKFVDRALVDPLKFLGSSAKTAVKESFKASVSAGGALIDTGVPLAKSTSKASLKAGSYLGSSAISFGKTVSEKVVNSELLKSLGEKIKRKEFLGTDSLNGKTEEYAQNIPLLADKMAKQSLSEADFLRNQFNDGISAMDAFRSEVLQKKNNDSLDSHDIDKATEMLSNDGVVNKTLDIVAKINANPEFSEDDKSDLTERFDIAQQQLASEVSNLSSSNEDDEENLKALKELAEKLSEMIESIIQSIKNTFSKGASATNG